MNVGFGLIRLTFIACAQTPCPLRGTFSEGSAHLARDQRNRWSPQKGPRQTVQTVSRLAKSQSPTPPAGLTGEGGMERESTLNRWDTDPSSLTDLDLTFRSSVSSGTNQSHPVPASRNISKDYKNKKIKRIKVSYTFWISCSWMRRDICYMPQMTARKSRQSIQLKNLLILHSEGTVLLYWFLREWHVRFV